MCCFYTCVCRLKAPWVPIDTIDCNSSSGAVSNCYNQPCQWSTDNRTLRGARTMSFNPSCGYLKGWGGCSSSAHAPVTHSRWPLRWRLVGSNMKGRMNSISPGWTLWFDMAAQLGKGLPSAAAVLCTSSSSQGFYGWRVCLESLGTGALGGQSSVCCLPKEVLIRAVVDGYLLDVCTLLSLVTVVLELSSVHIYTYTHIHIYIHTYL